MQDATSNATTGPVTIELQNLDATSGEDQTITIYPDTFAYTGPRLQAGPAPEAPRPRRGLSQKEKTRRKKKRKQTARSKRRNR